MDTKDDTQQYPQSDLIILAGRRDRRDAFLHMHNVDSKGLIPMNGQPLISYVMDAAQNADICRSIVIIGETDLFIDFMLTEGRENIHLVEPEDTIVDSLEKAFAFLAKHYEDDFKPVLVTTADHPLLNAGILTDFYTQSVQSQAEATFGFTFLHDVLRSYPKTMRTKLAFKDGMISGCNLFFFGTKNALSLPAFWHSAYAEIAASHGENAGACGSCEIYDKAPDAGCAVPQDINIDRCGCRRCTCCKSARRD